MIKLLSEKYNRHIAWPFFMLFYFQLVFPLLSKAAQVHNDFVGINHSFQFHSNDKNSEPINVSEPAIVSLKEKNSGLKNSTEKGKALKKLKKLDIGGPSAPEATSFKAVGSDNLVNLFSGNFSYSIPLMDVGGYPVNLFYNGGITMDQEASWVGLGWNINPGSVSRNMRGVPDDFNGSDALKVWQNAKPNRTWGGEVDVDAELLGLKMPNVGLSLGLSYNNYLGPALDLGTKLSLNIPITESVKAEKSASNSLSITPSVGAKLSSRSGMTFSASLSANLASKDQKSTVNTGIGLTTSYNSRTGMKDLTLFSQMSTYSNEKKTAEGETKKDQSHLSGSIGSSSISFAKPSYMPTIRMPMKNAYYSGQIEFGFGMFGVRGSITGSGYYSQSKVSATYVTKPLVGFMYSEMATGKTNAVMDFTRMNDQEVTPHTPVISAPQYAYDIFSIQGEGTGGTIRAYRGDLGFMRDNATTSTDENISIGVDIAPAGHYGVNWNVINSPTTIGGWNDANNTLNRNLSFRGKSVNDANSFENIYFRNPGEATVTSSENLNRIGADNLVRFRLGGSNVTPKLESKLELFNSKTGSAKGILPISNAANNLHTRDKRTQVTTMLNAQDASVIGLDKKIKNYTGSVKADTLEYLPIQRVGSYRKAHHISEIDVLEQSGMRYVYGLPVYNVMQKDFTFSVADIPNSDNLVGFAPLMEPSTDSWHTQSNSKIDGYVQIQETPAYASSFLLTGLISPDYVDINGDGITEDDLGTAVKFNYTMSSGLHKWRTPRGSYYNGYSAQFNEGLKTEKKDNKANLTYGEREGWYMSSIESKSMIAIFKTSDRNDAKGVTSELNGSINSTEKVNKKLDEIYLYTKAEIRSAGGITNAKSIKKVKFWYSYKLCQGTPDNNGSGKLTLDSITFSYNGQERNSKEKYVFNYGNTDTQDDNPSYKYNASDRWGTYKDPTDPTVNPSGLTNAEYPYTDTNKVRSDKFAAAWSLKKILLPSGGQMEITYEGADYGYVQNRRACNMYSIYGLGNSTESNTNNFLYNLGNATTDNLFVYIHLPHPLESSDPVKIKKEIYTKYLESLNQLAFKLQIQMPKGLENLTVYSEFDDYGLCSNATNNDIIYVRLKPMDGKSPLAKSAIGFLTENIPGQAFPGYEVEVNGVEDFIGLVGDMLGSIKNAFKNVDNQMRSDGKAREILLTKSFLRLDNPDRFKNGGGLRVKKVIVKDNWDRMTNQYLSMYGQDYDYTTTEVIDGKETTISSGVASYEPGVGSEENPFREILSFNDKMPMASAQYGAIEMPMLEGLYPSPSVGYSKVTVRSIHRKETLGDTSLRLRSAIGKQVTEFYTARDYPSYSTVTPISKLEYNKNPFFSFFYKEVVNRKTVSQGFLVETNDMHGKMKSQAAYSESDEKTPLSYSYHSYKNTGKNGLNDLVSFVDNQQGGLITKGNMGIDVELMTDVREFKVESDGFNGQLQIDFFTFVPFPVFAIPFMPLKSYIENKYRAVTCTKLINYHAIEDSVLVMDKGSVISTKTIAYDAETGTPIITQTANEFNDPIYNVSYPAYWAYSGMSPAYKNIGREFKASFLDGKPQFPTGVTISPNDFESGDEVYVTNQGIPPFTGCGANIASGEVTRLWAYDTKKESYWLPKNIKFMDSTGKFFTRDNVSFRIIRSGKRNLLGSTIQSLTTMALPIKHIGSVDKLIVDSTANVVQGSATEFRERWQVDNNVFSKKKYVMTDISSTIPQIAAKVAYSCYNNHGRLDFTFPQATTFPIELVTAWTYNAGQGYGWGGVDLPCGTILLGTNAPIKINIPESTTIFHYDNPNWSCSYLNNNNKVSNVYLKVSTPSRYIANFTRNGGLANILNDASNVTTCGVVGTVDCINGELERDINPYVKGLLGNFKPNRSYTCYGLRRETDPTAPISIRTSGHIRNFISYWGFYPSGFGGENNGLWVWNSELTKQNAKGQEVETKNLLGIYTSAQYGYAKNLPVAMVQNAKQGEGFFEGFEDNLYNETLNKSASTGCPKKYIDLSGMLNSQIGDFSANNVIAHSGKKVLKITNNKTATIDIPVISDPLAEDYSLATTENAQGSLTHLGVSGRIISPYFPPPLPGNQPMKATIYWLSPSYSDGFLYNVGINYPIAYDCINGANECRYFYFDSTKHFVTITKCGTYTFQYSTKYSFDANMSIKIKTLQDIEIETVQVGMQTNNTTKERVFTMKCELGPGIYKIFTRASDIEWQRCQCVSGNICNTAPGNVTPNNPCVVNCDQSPGFMKAVEYGFKFTLFNGTPICIKSYLDTASTVLCRSTNPIAAKTEMVNPTFSIPAGKKMLLSAWVKEDCTTPCTALTFVNNKITLYAAGTLSSLSETLIPTGNIIEGWQRYEADFTVPAGATKMTLSFVNLGGGAVYFDDIRIHPFNSNMKSYVYNPQNLRLTAELDENNYASFYDYDEEGQLVRIKKETIEGIKTIKETRTAKQKLIKDFQ